MDTPTSVIAMLGSGGFPSGSSESCTFGPRGWPGRALRDAWGFMVNNTAVSFLWLLVAGLFATLFFVGQVTPREGDLGKSLSVLEGALVGTAVTVGIVAIYGLTPWARRRHWRNEFQTLDNGEVVVGLRSGHAHSIRNPLLEILGPKGQREEVSLHPHLKDQLLTYGRGENLGMVHFTRDFEVRNGRYRFRWVIDLEHSSRKIVIARASRRFSASIPDVTP